MFNLPSRHHAISKKISTRASKRNSVWLSQGIAIIALISLAVYIALIIMLDERKIYMFLSLQGNLMNLCFHTRYRLTATVTSYTHIYLKVHKISYDQMWHHRSYCYNDIAMRCLLLTYLILSQFSKI